MQTEKDVKHTEKRICMKVSTERILIGHLSFDPILLYTMTTVKGFSFRFI